MRVKYKNVLYRIISANNLEPDDFELLEKKDEGFHIITLKHKYSPFTFIARNSARSYELFDFQYTEYGPDFVLSPFFPNEEFTEFDNVASEFDDWLNASLKEYIEDQKEVDLWSQLKLHTKSFDINSIDFDNQNDFLLEEKKQVKLAINELKLLINHRFNISDSEQEIVNNRLDYLIDATERLNKYDWKSLVVSTLISISVALSFDTEKGKLLFELFRKVFLQIQSIGH